MEKVIIAFKDGTQIEADLNGNCYVTDSQPSFPADLSEVTVTSQDQTQIFHHAVITECASVDGRYWWVFTEMSEAERSMRQIQANLEYIAMMTDVDLDEEE